MRVMIAFGGKSEKGARKEKSADMPVLGEVVDELSIIGGVFSDRRETMVRKRAVTVKTAAMMILGGRMMLLAVGGIAAPGTNQLLSCYEPGEAASVGGKGVIVFEVVKEE